MATYEGYIFVKYEYFGIVSRLLMMVRYRNKHKNVLLILEIVSFEVLSFHAGSRIQIPQ
jgi:hypothetical protein